MWPEKPSGACGHRFEASAAQPVEQEGVISWSATHVLVVDEALVGARVTRRRGGEVPVAVARGSEQATRSEA